MEPHDARLHFFLAGELADAEARAFDEHLLRCSLCWAAVREDREGRVAAESLREPVPGGLADRVRLAVEIAASERSRPDGRRLVQTGQPVARARAHRTGARAHRTGARTFRARLAVVGSLAMAVLAIAVLGARHESLLGRSAGQPSAVALIASYARQLPAGHPGLSLGPRPVRVGGRLEVRAGVQRIVLQVWRFGRTEAVVATSDQPFAMPFGATGRPGMGMAWSARDGRVALYCVNGTMSELIAGPVQADELARMIAELPAV